MTRARRNRDQGACREPVLTAGAKAKPEASCQHEEVLEARSARAPGHPATKWQAAASRHQLQLNDLVSKEPNRPHVASSRCERVEVCSPLMFPGNGGCEGEEKRAGIQCLCRPASVVSYSEELTGTEAGAARLAGCGDDLAIRPTLLLQQALPSEADQYLALARRFEAGTRAGSD